MARFETFLALAKLTVFLAAHVIPEPATEAPAEPGVVSTTVEAAEEGGASAPTRGCAE